MCRVRTKETVEYYCGHFVADSPFLDRRVRGSGLCVVLRSESLPVAHQQPYLVHQTCLSFPCDSGRRVNPAPLGGGVWVQASAVRSSIEGTLPSGRRPSRGVVPWSGLGRDERQKCT